MISLVKTERGHWHRHRDLPALANFVERGPQLFDEVEEVVLVAKGATSVSSSRIFPIKIEAIEFILVHEICQRDQRSLLNLFTFNSHDLYFLSRNKSSSTLFLNIIFKYINKQNFSTYRYLLPIITRDS